MSAGILLVEDDAVVSAAVQAALRKLGHEVRACPSAELAWDEARRHAPALVLLDVHLPGRTGIELLPDLLGLAPAPRVIVITAQPTAEIAMDAMALGAAALLEKPLDPARLRQVVEETLASAGVGAVSDDPALPRLVGSSRAMLDLGRRIGALARTDVSVLIQGESGTGKELVARAIHERSARAARPLVAVSCAVLPEALFEAELFGHERGAYTGAHQAQAGRVERAEGGTLFLDEVGELPPPAQAKLLRFLEERTYERVGGGETRQADVRVIAATNAPLERRVEEGRFREDLYYRLDVASLRVPPLRERREDIPQLVAHFLARAGRAEVQVDPDAQALLLSRRWPGNVRELRNAVESGLVSLGGGARLGVEHVPRAGAGAALGVDTALARVLRERVERALAGEEPEGLWSRCKDELERELIAAALAATGGNQVAAARLLDLNRATLRRKMEAYGLRDE